MSPAGIFRAMDVAIPLYDRFTALDAIGPYEVLSRLPGYEVVFVASEPGPCKTDNGMLTVVAERSLDDMPSPEILVVPGGKAGKLRLMESVAAWVL